MNFATLAMTNDQFPIANDQSLRSNFQFPMTNFLQKNKWAWSLASGVLLALAFPPFNLPLMAFVAFVPLLFAFDQATHRSQLIRSTFLMGVVFFAILAHWLLFLAKFSPLAFGIYLFCIVFSAAFYGFFGWVMWSIKKRWPAATYAALPFVWIALESVREWGDLGWTWGQLGYSLAPMPFLNQFADITGHYGISLWVISVNVLIFLLIKNRSHQILRLKLVIALLALIVVPNFYNVYRWNQIETGPTLKVAVIQPDIEQELKWNPNWEERNFNKLADLSRKAAIMGAQLIVWPEAAIANGDLSAVRGPESIAALTYVKHPTGSLAVALLARSLKIPILTGALLPADAENGDTLSEHLPWYNFLTTK